jgi:hypothetical protein
MECFIGERSPWPEYRILFLWRMRLKDTKFVKQVEADQYSIIGLLPLMPPRCLVVQSNGNSLKEEFSEPPINVSMVCFFFFF